MLTKMIETLKKNPRTIVYTEGTDKRILESAHRLTQAVSYTHLTLPTTHIV